MSISPNKSMHANEFYRDWIIEKVGRSSYDGISTEVYNQLLLELPAKRAASKLMFGNCAAFDFFEERARVALEARK